MLYFIDTFGYFNNLIFNQWEKLIMLKENKKSIDRNIDRIEFFLLHPHRPYDWGIKGLFKELRQKNTQQDDGLQNDDLIDELVTIIQKIMTPQFEDLIALLGQIQKIDPEKIDEEKENVRKVFHAALRHHIIQIMNKK